MQSNCDFSNLQMTAAMASYENFHAGTPQRLSA